MATEEQIAANRLNAQSSAGPKTETGRNRSRTNALRHGLTGQVITMTEEHRGAHDTLAKALMKDLSPEGAMETRLAQRIATDSWRLNRASAIEDNLFGALTTARVFTIESSQNTFSSSRSTNSESTAPSRRTSLC
jgi:hypothetical protein